MARPIILVCVDDETVRSDFVEALGRRYVADYDVRGVPAGGARAVVDLASAGAAPVSLALAPLRLYTTEDMASVRSAFPSARRVAIIQVGDASLHDELNQALTLNQVDYHLGHPWATPEEELYPITAEALRVWSHHQELRYDKATLVDEAGGGEGRELASWLTRNSVAATAHAADSAEGRALVDGPLAGVPLPAAVLYNGRVLSRPTTHELAEALGAKTRPGTERYDVTIVGAGPAGLAAGAYAAAEGLRTLVIEHNVLGGQAGTSTKIRNYLGFRWGISGGDLVASAARQAEQLGAEFVITRSADRLAAEGDDCLLTLSNGDVVRSGAVILAGGVAYRRLGVPSVDGLIGRGVFYGAGASEAATMGGLRVYVLGAGNSAGQAACALAAAGASVTIVLRGDSLASSMSDYLVQQVSSTPGLDVRPRTQIVDALGDQHLEGLVLQTDGAAEPVPADALFAFIGAQPHTGWLEGTIATDSKGFVLTGRDLPEDRAAPWLETSMPGVFAAGDIRFGSIKRVAAAVGEGSTAAMLAMDHLQPH